MKCPYHQAKARTKIKRMKRKKTKKKEDEKSCTLGTLTGTVAVP